MAESAGRGRPTNIRWWIRLLDPSRLAVEAVSDQLVPAWRRVSKGEPRLAVTVGVVAAIGLEAALPDRVANGQRWATAMVAALLLIGIVLANPTRINRRSPACAPRRCFSLRCSARGTWRRARA